jgi:hypothetical protein
MLPASNRRLRSFSVALKHEKTRVIGSDGETVRRERADQALVTIKTQWVSGSWRVVTIVDVSDRR